MFTKSWISSLERAIKAFAQTFVAILSVEAHPVRGCALVDGPLDGWARVRPVGDDVGRFGRGRTRARSECGGASARAAGLRATPLRCRSGGGPDQPANAPTSMEGRLRAYPCLRKVARASLRPGLRSRPRGRGRWVRPPVECVESRNGMVVHRMSMSGWWFISSARAPTTATRRMPSAKMSASRPSGRIAGLLPPVGEVAGERGLDLVAGQQVSHGANLRVSRSASARHRVDEPPGRPLRSDPQLVVSWPVRRSRSR